MNTRVPLIYQHRQLNQTSAATIHCTHTVKTISTCMYRQRLVDPCTKSLQQPRKNRQQPSRRKKRQQPSRRKIQRRRQRTRNQQCGSDFDRMDAPNADNAQVARQAAGCNGKANCLERGEHASIQKPRCRPLRKPHLYVYTQHIHIYPVIEILHDRR